MLASPISADRRASRLLLHEWVFGAFLVAMWIRLSLKAGPLSGEALFYLACLGVNAALIWVGWDPASSSRWRWRLAYYPVAMNLIFANLKSAVPALTDTRQDPLLERIDALLLGKTASLHLEPFIHPALTEALSFCYILFFPYLLLSMATYFLGPLADLRAFCVGLFTIYGLGFMGYSWVPAAGPFVAMSGEFKTALAGGWITALNQRVVTFGSNGVDVFPSLHCAVSCFLLFFDRDHKRWRYRLYLIPCVGLWISTLYLRYHYLIDLVAGFLVAAIGIAAARRAFRTNPEDGLARSR